MFFNQENKENKIKETQKTGIKLTILFHKMIVVFLLFSLLTSKAEKPR